MFELSGVVTCLGVFFLLAALLVTPSTLKINVFSVKDLLANFDSRKQSLSLVGSFLIAIGTFLV